MDKQQLLQELDNALVSGSVTTQEITAIVQRRQPEQAYQVITQGQAQQQSQSQSQVLDQQPVNATNQNPKEGIKRKLSAAEIMFYVAGIIIYAALYTLSGQIFGDISLLPSAMLFFVVGAAAWGVSLAFSKKDDSTDSEVVEGGMNAVSLFGSFSLITSSFILSERFSNSLALEMPGEMIVAAITLIIIGAIHIGYAFASKRTFILLIGVLLSTLSFLFVMFSILDRVETVSVWSMVFIVFGFLLTRATRLINKTYPVQDVRTSLDGLAIFIGLFAMYAASFEEVIGLAWLALIIMSIFGLFYMSIQKQSKQALGIASFFLILAIVTISFRYFSGFGAAFALLISASGILGSAIIATNINKKYIKNS